MGYEYCFDDTEYSAERIRMLKYARTALGELDRIKTPEEFHRAANKELSFWGLNPKDMENSIHVYRNYICELYKRFTEKGLVNLGLEDMILFSERLANEEGEVDSIHKRYFDLTEKTSPFYEQYKVVLEDVFEYLESEIENRKLEGDYR